MIQGDDIESSPEWLPVQQRGESKRKVRRPSRWGQEENLVETPKGRPKARVEQRRQNVGGNEGWNREPGYSQQFMNRVADELSAGGAQGEVEEGDIPDDAVAIIGGDEEVTDWSEEVEEEEGRVQAALVAVADEPPGLLVEPEDDQDVDEEEQEVLQEVDPQQTQGEGQGGLEGAGGEEEQLPNGGSAYQANERWFNGEGVEVPEDLDPEAEEEFWQRNVLQQQVGEDEVEEAVVGGFQSQDDIVTGFVPQPIGNPVLPQGLPTWEEAHTNNIPTIKHIPKGAREEWARVLAKAINDVSSTPDNSQLWLLLYILPRCILPARPKNQGYQQAQSAAKVIKAACRKWREGKIVELWQEALMLKRKVGKEKLKKRKKKKKQAEHALGEERTQVTRNRERATELAQEGQLSRAAKALVSRGVDLNSEAAKKEMEEKHPQVEEAALPQGEHSVAALILTSNQVFKAIWGFKAGTAPGPSGLRGEHLKEAKAVRTEGRGAATVGALTRFVNVLVKGKIPKEVSPFFFGANLFALVKKDGGFRPVAVGNTLRRLASKCVSYAVSGRASTYLRPIQFGVGVRGGCEAVVHATRATLEDQSIPLEEKWSLQVDLRNCFNQVDRGAMFKEVREHFPEIARFVEAAYGQNSNLNFGESTILSTTGTHQGCPLAPLLTALTIQPVAKKVQEVDGMRQNSWFLDDGELIGKKEALGKAWDILVEEGAPRGLHLNPDKSVVFCPGHDEHDLDPLGKGVQRAVGGIKLLGAPIGEDGFVEAVLRKRLAGVQAMLGELHQLEDPHIELTLLRNCFALPKFSFALRTVDTSRHPAVLEEFDSSVKEAAEAILGAPLPPLQYGQAALPISMGGLGLRQAKQHGSAAYLASVGDASAMVQDIRLQLQE